MHTSGLVLTLCDDAVAAETAERALANAGPFTLGNGLGSRRAATLEVTTPKAAHAWHDWATALPGVEGVEVVFVHWEDAEVLDAHD
jgi:hypothetical protein